MRDSIIVDMKYADLAVSIDTHTPHQIFHPCWWIDENGNNPAPYTPITLADLDSGKYRAVIYPRQSRDYVEHLEKDGKKTLCVWSYHCLQGTSGAAFENQFANMIYFHSVAKKAVTQRLVKGQDPLSEMYGIRYVLWFATDVRIFTAGWHHIQNFQ